MTIQLETYVNYWLERITQKLDSQSVEIIKRFDNELKAADSSNNTRKGYLATLYQFLMFVKKPIPDVTKDDMTLFLNSLATQKISTRKNYNRKLARFFKWHDKDLDLYVKFAKSTKDFELHNWSDKLPTMDEIERMLAVCTHPRDKALFSLLVESGARIGEILRMTYGDVKINDVYVRASLRARKTKRDIPVIWSSKHLLQWLDLHPTKNAAHPLWPQKNAITNLVAINYQTAFMIIKKLKEKARIEKDINPKLFRHLRATIFAKDPRTSTQIKKAYLGHSPRSTIFETTYQHLSQDDVVDSILQSYGLKEDDETISQVPELKTEVCPRCGTPVTKHDKYCSKCWLILDQQEALYHDQEVKKQSEILTQLMLLLQELIGKEKIGALLKELR